MSYETVNVDLGDRSYDIHIGPNLVPNAGGFIKPHLIRNHVAIITDENVAGLHLKTLEAGLTAAGISSVVLTLPAGEATKSWEMLQKTVEWLLSETVSYTHLTLPTTPYV